MQVNFVTDTLVTSRYATRPGLNAKGLVNSRTAIGGRMSKDSFESSAFGHRWKDAMGDRFTAGCEAIPATERPAELKNP